MALRAVAAAVLFASPADAVPIDLTGSTPSVTGPTSLNFVGVKAMESTYCMDLEWDAGRNRFEVTDYEDESGKATDLFGDLEKSVSRLAAPRAFLAPIELSEATPMVAGATTMSISGIVALGSTYWADFEWDSGRNGFGGVRLWGICAGDLRSGHETIQGDLDLRLQCDVLRAPRESQCDPTHVAGRQTAPPRCLHFRHLGRVQRRGRLGLR